MSLSNNQVEKQLLNLTKKLNDNSAMSTEELDRLWQELNQLQLKSQISICDLQFRASDDPTNENITVTNTGSLIVDISGWKINAGSPDQCYTFPDGTMLFPKQEITVTTSGNSPFSFNSARPIWNNQGDIATLLNDKGELISCWVYGLSAHNDIVISHINIDGENGKGEADEFIELINTSSHLVDLAKWRIESLRSDVTFIFPDHSYIEPETSLRVFTNKNDLEENEYSYHSRRAIWNNQSGGATLVDYLDRNVCVYHY